MRPIEWLLSLTVICLVSFAGCNGGGGREKTMTQQNIPQIAIRPADHLISRQVPGQWELKVLWRFENRAGVPLYVLIALPLTTRIAEPLILDHSSPGGARQVDPNYDPGFSIMTIPPSGMAERRLTYHLALPDSIKRATVIGRFGYSDFSPDPAWEKTKNWVQAAAWQKIADSESLTVVFNP